MMNFFDFLQALQQPALALTVLLTLGVVLVNGWTDAPNAIATSVSTRSIPVRAAILMAALMNFLGVLLMTSLNKTVAITIMSMVDFGADAKGSLVALCAAMVAIVLWATAAWYFGIPTSESHALIAGLSGAAIAVHGNFSGIHGEEWLKVIYGLLLSSALGLSLGFLLSKTIRFLFRRVKRRRANDFFRLAQVGGAAAMAFMHGAQDGQKFMGVFLLGLSLSQGTGAAGSYDIPLWLMALCSAVMALGTSIGGYKIIKSVGMDMVKMEKYEGFAADAAGALSLLVASVFGMPVSTTHTKTTAIMGVGAAKRLNNVNWSLVGEMSLAWLLTFPGCGLIGYLMAKLFIQAFA